MINRFSLSLLLCLVVSFFGFGQGVGDIAFLQYNGDGGGQDFKFITFVDIPVGSQINFTDNGWINSGGFRTNEGFITWTSPGVNCGDVITITETGSFALADSGDQIIAYTGTLGSPTPIAAIQMNGNWDGDATSAATSSIPFGLINGTNCLSIEPEVDNAIYNGTLTGTIASLRSAINNSSNWLTNNSTQQTFTGTFNVTDCGGVSDPNLSINGITDHGSSCIGLATTSIQYTITNSSTSTLSADGISVSSNDSQFTVSNLSSNSIAPSGTATFDVTFTPSSEGSQSSTLEVTSSTGTSNTATISISGIGLPLPSITNEPSDQVVSDGDSATFSVVATSAASYQWEQSTDGVVWTNVGTDSNQFTIGSASLSQDGYQYRVVISSATCGNITSNIATLRVFNSACIDEDFNPFPSGWINAGTSEDSDITHYGNASPCRAFSNGDILITTNVDYPEYLTFYQDSSNGGNGQTASVDYRINSGGWQSLFSYNVTTVGNVETVDLSSAAVTDLSQEENVQFRFSSGFSTWYLDDVKVFCTPCTAPMSTTVVNPLSGPIGTCVTITGSDFTALTEVTFNGESAAITSQTTSTLEVIVPNNATDGDLVITTPGSTICDSTIFFDIIDEEQGCQSSLDPAPTDLFFYEIFDENNLIDGPPVDYGNGGMITVFNGTLETKNLSDYRIYRNSNYPNNTANFVQFYAPTGTLAPGELYRLYVDGSLCTQYETPYDTVTATGFNEDDAFELRKWNGSVYENIDQVLVSNQVSGDQDAEGYYYLRDLSSMINKPSNSYNSSDWIIEDNTQVNAANPCRNVGVTPVFNGDLPNIVSVSEPSSVCESAIITVEASEGYNVSASDTNPLNFIWYYYNGSGSWIEITSGGDYTINTTVNDNSGTGTTTLTVDNVLGKQDYQFYCKIEEGSSCFVATNALKLDFTIATWDGANWNWSDSTPQDTVPTSNALVILNADYDTSSSSIETSFSCCRLQVNNSVLTIQNSTYVEVINELDVNGANGSVLVSPQGAFVQRNGDQTYVTADNPELIQVTKTTAPMDTALEYTYWSSPVQGETIGDALADANPGRRFRFSAEDYRDSRDEGALGGNNDNQSGPGQDDVDDNGLDDYVNDNTGYDWQLVSSGDTMLPGVGYISTHSPTIFNSSPCSTNADPNCRFDYTFNGLFNNGIIQVEIFRNDDEQNDNNWNLIGNPYPSAISADAFLDYNSDISTAANKAITGAIYLWSHDTEANGNVSGNEINNFSQSDYAVINGVGQIGGSEGGDSGNIGSNPSNRMIPSGQSFFVAMSDGMNVTTSSHPKPGATIAKTPVVFNNDMRVLGANDNSQFFRSASKKDKQANRNANDATERLWLNLNSDNGVFSQILIGYKEGATDGLDIAYFDAQRNKAVGAYTEIYTMIPETDKVFAIQGKSPESLTIDEVIPLGFATSINEATLYTLSIDKLEGAFLTSNPIYVKDYLLGVTHNLTNSDYSFTSDVGEFNDRFVIVFQEDSLSLSENELDANDLTIIELQDGKVQFSVPTNFEISNIELIDLLGRTVYRFNTNNSHTTIHNLDALSNSAYIARVVLTNGQVLTQKAIKRK